MSKRAQQNDNSLSPGLSEFPNYYLMRGGEDRLSNVRRRRAHVERTEQKLLILFVPAERNEVMREYIWLKAGFPTSTI